MGGKVRHGALDPQSAITRDARRPSTRARAAAASASRARAVCTASPLSCGLHWARSLPISHANSDRWHGDARPCADATMGIACGGRTADRLRALWTPWLLCGQASLSAQHWGMLRINPRLSAGVLTRVVRGRAMGISSPPAKWAASTNSCSGSASSIAQPPPAAAPAVHTAAATPATPTVAAAANEARDGARRGGTTAQAPTQVDW